MSSPDSIAPKPETSPRTIARVAGAFYLLNFVAGSVGLVLTRRGGPAADAINLAADACYVAVTLLFYRLFAPVSRGLSLLAALVGLTGCVASALGPLHLGRSPINPLAFFGVYCLVVSRLILTSTFLPRALGVLLALGGLGWLTFASPPLARQLSPYNMAPGIVGEGALVLWLLVVGLDAGRWTQRQEAARTRCRTAS